MLRRTKEASFSSRSLGSFFSAAFYRADDSCDNGLGLQRGVDRDSIGRAIRNHRWNGRASSGWQRAPPVNTGHDEITLRQV